MRITVIVLTILVFCQCTLSAHQPERINYFQGSYDELVVEAARLNKPYFLFFSYAGFEECQQLENVSFAQPSLRQYISQEYLAYKVEVGKPDRGQGALEERFEVLLFPSLIIFDPQSHEKERLGGYREAEDILDALHSIVQQRGQKSGTEPQGNTGSQTSERRIANEFFSEETGSNYTQEKEHMYTSESEILIEDGGAFATYEREVPNSSYDQAKPERDIFDITFDFEENNTSTFQRQYLADSYETTANQIDPQYLQEQNWEESSMPSISDRERNTKQEAKKALRGFGVQTAAFSDSYFMRRELDFLHAHFPHHVFVEKSQDQGQVLYKVQVGPFPSKAEALHFKEAFKKKTGNRKGMLVYFQY